MNEVRAIVTGEFNRRFKKSRAPKYGSIDKGFNEAEITAFFKVIDDAKFRLLFRYQACLGLRISEAIKVNICDINFDKRELTIKTEKAHTLDTLLIPMPLFNETVVFIKSHIPEHTESKGYLFYPDNVKSHKNNLFLDPNYARKKFREFVVKAKLDQTYATSEESIEGRSLRRLHRLTTHSLRHYAITKFAESTNGNVFLASKFARHSNPDVTLTYIHTNKKQLFSEIDNAFSTEDLKRFKEKLLI